MGVPEINITFRQKAIEGVKDGPRGTVALILKDTVPKANPIIMDDITDVPDTLSKENQEQISLAFMGYLNPTKKIIAYVIPVEATDFREAQHYFETVMWDYMAIPEIQDAQTTDMATWAKSLRSNKKKVVIVLPNTKGDHEAVVNYTNANNPLKGKTYTTAQYCSRIAGMFATTPLNISATYAPLPELLDCDHLTEEEASKKIDDGELVLINDGEKVKIARAVNSFVTTTQDKGEDYKKIKIIAVMDFITRSIRQTIADKYIGKIANSYINKMFLIGTINVFLETLEDKEILERNQNLVELNIKRIKEYLKEKGTDITKLNPLQIKEANTKSHIFLSGKVSILDAFEDLDLDLEDI